MNVRFVDLPRQNNLLRSQLLETIEKIIDQAIFIEGQPLEDFEQSFAKFCNKKYAVGVNSGTDALKFALIAYGIGGGDEVITAPNGYFSVAAVVSEIGGTPVFLDINPNTYTIDVNKLEKKITKKTRAIIPVHLYGQPADMDPILDLAKKYNLVVIEDACQAHGAKYKVKVVPIGETGAFSFFPGKNLGCFGDGGVLVTDNPEIADKVRYLRNDGSIKKYVHKMLGFKSRLDTLQAAILNFKLNYLEEWNNQRRAHAKKYNEFLKKLPEVKIPFEADYAEHVFHIYVIEIDQRDELQSYLKEKGIETGIHYPTPIHLQEPYLKEGFKEGDFPITEKKVKVLLSLPMFPELTVEEIEYVCFNIKEFFNKQ